jgi:hypothetical protein
MPPAGKMSHRNANSSTNRIPSHQAGTANEIAAKYATARSSRLPTRVAIRTPTTKPTTAVMIDEVVSSRIVFGNRSSTIAEIRLLPSAVRRERASPRSSRSTRQTADGSRVYQGRSKP